MIEYKKIIKNREVRNTLLKLLCFVPDKMMIRLQYRIKFGRRLELVNPKRFTEKLQWYKLYYHNQLMKQCVDKYEVRKYVSSRGLGSILVPLIGIFDEPEQIDFEQLPLECVFKDTLGGGGNSVIVCKNIKEVDVRKLKAILNRWVASCSSYKTGGREWPYGGNKHRIIVEEMLPSSEEKGGLIDYKFFCFYGEPKIVYVITDRKVGEKASLGIFDIGFKRLDVNRCDENKLLRDIPKPKSYDNMLDICRKLSAPFPEVRVDLYFIEDKVYFGEMTFFDGSGYMSFDPDDFDYFMGDLFELPKRKM